MFTIILCKNLNYMNVKKIILNDHNIFSLVTEKEIFRFPKCIHTIKNQEYSFFKTLKDVFVLKRDILFYFMTICLHKNIYLSNIVYF